MKNAKWVTVGLLGVAVAVVWVWLGARQPATGPTEGEADEQVRAGAATAGTAHSGQAVTGRGAEVPAAAGRTKAPSSGGSAAGGTVTQAGPTAREASFSVWQNLVGDLQATNAGAMLDRALTVKAAFDRLDPADQMDGVRMALHLMTDEQFPWMYGILFDMAQPPAVLDAIFSDGLNRPEDVKESMLRVLVTDKRHPMFFESARILDAMGTLLPAPPGNEEEDEPQEAAEPTEATTP